MRFINYSDRPLVEMPSFQQFQLEARGSKPNGIWLSVVEENGRDSWKDYCERTNHPLKPYRTEVIISKEARILHLATAKEIDQITNRYGYFRECREHEKSNPDYTRSSIHWDQVAQQYAGIIITPYCEERHRLDLWYFTWDCASGCMWSKDAIKEMNPLKLRA